MSFCDTHQESSTERTKEAVTASFCSFGFGEAYRILSHKRFEEVFAQGKKSVGRYLIAWILPGETPEHRVGLVTAKKTFRHAVSRNRARRVLREAFRHLRPEFSGGPWDMVFVARRGADQISSVQMLEEVRQILQKRKLLQKEPPHEAVSARDC